MISLMNTGKLSPGSRFGLLTVLHKDSSDKRKHLCKCDCGTVKSIHDSNLHAGRSRSCGCKQGGCPGTHNMSKTPAYRRWADLRNRCNNVNNHAYGDYGGRGIKVCKRWDRFENFLEDMGPPPFHRAHIDRISNDNGYSPDNCRWVSAEVNCNNRRNTTMAKIDGVSMGLMQACKLRGVHYRAVRSRMRRGISAEEAIRRIVEKRSLLAVTDRIPDKNHEPEGAEKDGA